MYGHYRQRRPLSVRTWLGSVSREPRRPSLCDRRRQRPERPLLGERRRAQRRSPGRRAIDELSRRTAPSPTVHPASSARALDDAMLAVAVARGGQRFDIVSPRAGSETRPPPQRRSCCPLAHREIAAPPAGAVVDRSLDDTSSSTSRRAACSIEALHAPTMLGALRSWTPHQPWPFSSRKKDDIGTASGGEGAAARPPAGLADRRRAGPVPRRFGRVSSPTGARCRVIRGASMATRSSSAHWCRRWLWVISQAAFAGPRPPIGRPASPKEN